MRKNKCNGLSSLCQVPVQAVEFTGEEEEVDVTDASEFRCCHKSIGVEESFILFFSFFPLAASV